MLARTDCTWLILVLSVLAGSRAFGQERPPTAAAGQALALRIGLEQLRNPYWYADHGMDDEARQFWDKDHWQRALSGWAADGYNALLYWPEPWTETAWQGFLIRHEEFPEARELTADQAERIIEHTNWIFEKAHELGITNYLFTYQIVTTGAFAKAHGHDGELPVSASVDFRHNLQQYMGAAYGVRNESTRAFTEAATAELLRTYPALDGLCGAMGEAVPGKKSTWYREAVVPGLRRSGRKPAFIMMNWMMPLEAFLEDVAPRDVYDNTWLSVHANVEMFTDTRPYPWAVRWVERAGLPAIFEIVHHNHEAGFPSNSPRLAWEMVHEYRQVPNCRGFLAWYLRYDPNWLFRKALGYYGRHDEPYSDEPWIRLLEERFGDREAAGHLLKAYDASARIAPELTAIAWTPMDRGASHQLMLPYWYWTDEDPRFSYFTSPTRGNMLLPLRYYAKVVARLGDAYRDNSGADFANNAEHPGAQELIWGLGDYPTTPEAHMRHVRRLGEEALAEAEAALRTVKTNTDEAESIHGYMQAYKLLTDYYERKVLAATSALIYGFGGKAEDKADAERLADEAVELYANAIDFIWKRIDNERGQILGRWGGKTYTLPELIERERDERRQLPKLFGWPAEPAGDAEKAAPAETR